MPIPVVPKSNATPGFAPLPSDLQTGELAVNTTDGALYVKMEDGTIRLLAGSVPQEGGEVVAGSCSCDAGQFYGAGTQTPSAPSLNFTCISNGSECTYHLDITPPALESCQPASIETEYFNGTAWVAAPSLSGPVVDGATLYGQMPGDLSVQRFRSRIVAGLPSAWAEPPTYSNCCVPPEPVCVTETYSVAASGSVGHCSKTPTGGTTVSVPEGFSLPVRVTITGSVDDDLRVNGQLVYKDTPAYAGSCNGAGAFPAYTFMLNQPTITLEALDNHGAITGYDVTICFGSTEPLTKYTCNGNGRCVGDPNGQYNTPAECEASCSSPIADGYNCLSNGENGTECVPMTGPDAEFATLAECEADCMVGFNCGDLGNGPECVPADGLNVEFTTLQACEESCTNPAP